LTSAVEKVVGFNSFGSIPEGWLSSLFREQLTVDTLPSVAQNVASIKAWFDKILLLQFSYSVII
jgi:hypothetical protein